MFADLCRDAPIQVYVGLCRSSVSAYARPAHVDRSGPMVVCRSSPTLAEMDRQRSAWSAYTYAYWDPADLCLRGGLNAVMVESPCARVHSVSGIQVPDSDADDDVARLESLSVMELPDDTDPALLFRLRKPGPELTIRLHDSDALTSPFLHDRLKAR
ncbi:hypothetical protein B0H14DRAFT_3437393 [Mycena olivaceomarginata]|nr:hypothetical protein B0H14DRAFT_3437393 [Mycena olivaceomarginata]